MSETMTWAQQKYVPMYTEDYIAHHGIKGQRWGVRRFQDIKGRYTELGKKRYLAGSRKERKEVDKEIKRLVEKNAREDAAYAMKDLQDKSLKKNRTLYQNLQTRRMNKEGNISTWIVGPGFAGVHRYNLPHTLAARYNRKEAKVAMREGKQYVKSLNEKERQAASKKLLKEPKKTQNSSGMFGPEVTGKEAADFWKAYAAQIEKEQKRKKR